ncbi:major facilitator superfamily domain-containing protein [Phascolomyces articulosus]|uniref:Major facilitator superfamily domain-containing protein n=1 Tax=Phascolomyces articulosus TaxID=60185 RepID=A0AAD5K2E4_9FUNG|nr:major facilitator superfamily domain-containing protein [Phascolomyces articulosus]
MRNFIPPTIKQFYRTHHCQADDTVLPTTNTASSSVVSHNVLTPPPRIFISNSVVDSTPTISVPNSNDPYHFDHDEPLPPHLQLPTYSHDDGVSSTAQTSSVIEKNKHNHHRQFQPLSARIMALVKSRMAFRPPVPRDPRLFSVGQKRWILACLALGSSLNGLCSTIYFPGIPDITTEFGASDIEVTLTTSLFMLFGGIGPILWASMSDHYHIRRFLYLNSLLLFSVASIGCALSVNIYMLLILRMIQSVGTSVTISVGAGTVSDCWAITERGAAFSILFVGQFFGPLIGPVLGGGLTTALGWRSTFWFCTGYGLFLFFFLFTFLPETYRVEGRFPDVKSSINNYSSHNVAATTNTTIIAREDAETSTIATVDGDSIREQFTTVVLHDNSSTPVTIVGGRNSHPNHTTVNGDYDDDNGDHTSVVMDQEKQPQQRMNPFVSVLLLRHTFVWMIALGTGITFGTMFTVETVIPSLYETTYGFESWQTGLSYLGAGLGNLLGSIVSGWLSDHLLKQARQKRGGAAMTEDRLTMNAWPGGYILVPLGVLIFGWSVYTYLTVWASIIGFSIVCFGMSQVYTAGSAYLVDAIPGRGASVTGASNLMRMSMACILSLIAQPTVDAIGPGYLSVVLAGVNIFGISLFLLVKFKGQSMREHAGYGDNHE